MEKKWLIVICLLALPFASAEEWYYNSEQVNVQIQISSTPRVLATNPISSLSYLIVNLSFLPLERVGQEILQLRTVPEAELTDGNAVFRWDEPNENELPFKIEADVLTQNRVPAVREKIPFPVQDIPSSLEAYTKPSPTVDSDKEEIIRLASELAEGEDDLYKVVHKLGVWTKTNINYDLSTLTADISQKASWVLQTRSGVCDELTNLFIALNRALGIPARFVSGISYTNSPLFPDQWGSHGWAEVYFPGYGWIPFDVTYGEFGFVDPGHIKTKEGVDGNVSSVSYAWSGRNTDLSIQELDIQTTLKDFSGEIGQFVEVSVNPLKKSVSFGSYNLIEAALTNLLDAYASVPVFLSSSEEVEVIGEREKIVLLGPLETKKIYWTVKVENNLQQQYRYTFPLMVSTLHNSTGKSEFSSVREGLAVSAAQIEELLLQQKKEEQKIYSKNLELNCTISKKEFYTYENASINCNVENKGNIFLKNLSICMGTCETMELGISQSKEIVFPAPEDKVGQQEALVTAQNEEVSKAASVEFARWDDPAVEARDLMYPAAIGFGDTFEISFVLDKASASPPKNVKIELDQGPFIKDWEIKELYDPQSFALELNGDELGHINNTIELRASFEDNNGNPYFFRKTFWIGVKTPKIGQRIRMGLNQIDGALQSLSITGIIILVIIAIAVFTAIIRIVFKPRRSRKNI